MKKVLMILNSLYRKLCNKQLRPVYASVAILVFISCGHDLDLSNIFGGKPINNAEIRSFSVIQSGDTLYFSSGVLELEPNLPFEVHLTVIGGPGEMRAVITHNECGAVHDCGVVQSSCPSTKWSIISSAVGVSVSGLPGGREYQVYFQYKGYLATCRRINLLKSTDTSGNLSDIQILPIS